MGADHPAPAPLGTSAAERLLAERLLRATGSGGRAPHAALWLNEVMDISNSPSAPAWAGLATSDPAGAQRFYAGLFGWGCDITPDTDADGYGVFTTAYGARVGGVAALSDARRGSGWTPYFQCGGVDAVLARVRGNGGVTLVDAHPAPFEGFAAVCADPGGSAFGLWEPTVHAGFGVVDAPGSFCWFTLHTGARAAVEDFYGTVLGWATAADPATGQLRWTVDDAAFGNLEDSDVAPAQWICQVAVDDCAAAAVNAAALGGTMLAVPEERGGAVTALLQDPQGAVFGVVQLPG